MSDSEASAGQLAITLDAAKIPDDASTDFRIKLTDNAGNITPSASFSITSDNTAPQVTAIARPSSETIDTNATSVKFEVTTSEDVKVTEVTGTDFVVTPSGSNLTVAAIGRNGSDTNFANKFEVTVSGYATDYQGDISLALAAGKGSYTDPAGNPEASSQSPSIEKYVRDVTPPDYNDSNSLVEIKNTSVQNNPDIATATTVNQNGGVGDTIVAKLTVPASGNDLGSVEFDFSDLEEIKSRLLQLRLQLVAMTLSSYLCHNCRLRECNGRPGTN